MNIENREIMKNILYAVETGGQVYGNKKYDDFTEAKTNTSNEKAFYENIDCIKKLLHDLNHVDFKNDVLSNPVTNKANQFLKHKQTNTVIVKTKRG